MYKDLLNPEKALIFRIFHKSNVEKVLNDGGCLCGNDAGTSNYVEIGNQELIAKRKAQPVPCGPGGTLGDYVPFYFTPFTPILHKHQDRNPWHPEETYRGDRHSGIVTSPSEGKGDSVRLHGQTRKAEAGAIFG